MRENHFIHMSNDELENYYHEYIYFETKKGVSIKFLDLINIYKSETNEKAGFPILVNDLLNVIAHRWIEQNKKLRDFSVMLRL